MEIRFRPLARTDFPLLGAWLATPHVARWWADDGSPEALEGTYGACVDGSEPAQVYIASIDGEALGLVQHYRWGSYPAYLAALAPIMPLTPLASSIDYLLGPVPLLGRGLGSAMIAALAALVWREDRQTPLIVVPVQADNLVSQRALVRAGFVELARGMLEPDNPLDRWDHRIYGQERPASGSAGALAAGSINIASGESEPARTCDKGKPCI